MGDFESTRRLKVPLQDPVSSVDWSEVEEIFTLASEMPPANRLAFLDSRCSASLELRREVESLIESDSQAGRFMADEVDVSASSNANGLQLPRRIGRYNLLQIIGEGGFGTVYLADQDRPIHRRVAIKVIRQGMASRAVMARFEVEQQALALMEHPGIAKVFDAGETDSGQPYFVMELVDGISITRYCDQNKLNTKSRLELFNAVCHALQHAHQKGIIHRDIKSSNILVPLQEGIAIPKLIDFGIAKATNESAREASLIGTPVYMSPEQTEPGGGEIDIRTDIYSLGVLLYELLTGATPFGPRESQKVARDPMLQMIREVDPPRPSAMLANLGETLGAVAASRGTSPRELANQVRGDLDCIVQKAMAKKRERRYESAGELARDVGRYLHHEPVDASPAGTPYLLKKFVVRNRTMVGIAAAALFAAIVAGTGYIQSIHNEQRKTNAALGVAEKESIEVGRQRDEANRNLVNAAVALAHGSQTSLASGRRFDSLAVLTEAAKINPSVQVRSQAIGCLALADLQVVKQWRGINDAICTNHDCTLYAEGVPALIKPNWLLAEVEKELLIRRVPSADVEDPAVLLQLKSPIWHQRAMFSPDDQLIAASGHDGHIRIYTLSGQPVLDVESGPCFDFSPDGKTFAAAGFHGPVDIYDIHTGKVIRELKWDAQEAISFSPDGQRLAMFSVSHPSAGVGVGDLISGRAGLLPHPTICCSIAWHPDGIHLAEGCDDGSICQWDVSDVNNPLPLPTLIGHHQNVFSVKFSHGGDVLASSAWDDSTRLWDPVSGEQLATVFGAGNLTFSSDDKSLAMSGYVGQHLIASIATGREERRTVAAPVHNLMRNVAFTPDGQTMALGGRNVIRFWNLSNLDAGIQSLDLPMTEQVNSVAFSPDGSSLLASADSGLVRVHIDNRPGPVDRHGRATMLRRIDPAMEQILSLPAHDAGQIQFSPDGNNVALGQWRQEPRLINLQDPSKITRLAGASLYSCYISWSSDGKWIATGNWRSNGDPSATIWDASTGKRVLDLPILLDSTVAFSPDNRWLVTCTADEYCFWQVGSWKPDHAIPRKADSAAYIIFSPDSRTLAISTSQLGCKLVEADTGAEIATFDDHGEGLPVGFSPDGTLLITSCQNAPAGPTLRLWELRGMRRELKEMNLDWSGPDLPTPRPTTRIVLVLDAGKL